MREEMLALKFLQMGRFFCSLVQSSRTWREGCVNFFCKNAAMAYRTHVARLIYTVWAAHKYSFNEGFKECTKSFQAEHIPTFFKKSYPAEIYTRTHYHEPQHQSYQSLPAGLNGLCYHYDTSSSNRGQTKFLRKYFKNRGRPRFYGNI